jgi:hypothetical protein
MRRSVVVNVLSAVLGGVLGGAGMQVFMGGPSAVAQSAPAAAGIVIAEEFRLVARDGKTRAQLMLWDGHRPMLLLGDDHCPARVTIGLSEQDGHPTLIFNDQDCRHRPSLDLIPDGLPELTFRDEADVPRARLHLLKDGSPVLRLFDPQGHTLWATGTVPGPSPQLKGSTTGQPDELKRRK